MGQSISKTSLPQDDANQSQRKTELQSKQGQYRLEQHYPSIWQLETLPTEEQFPFSLRFAINVKPLMSLIGKLMHPVNLFRQTQMPNRWESIAALKDFPLLIGLPESKYHDIWNDDVHFGRQRLAGVNPSLIKLVEAIPENFPVTDDLLHRHIEELSLRQAVQNKRLFLCDLGCLEGVYTMPGKTVCTPFCLLFLDSNQNLRPIAIQLFQTPADDNPIFTPADGEWLWTLVKMWFNIADATYHQAVHLGQTHFRMEGICVVTHRNLSTSHPIFKLLMPHFWYLLAINHLGLSDLVNKDGLVDKTFSSGSKGVLQIAAKLYNNWRMDVEGSLPGHLESRGVADPAVLPYYPYRDDAMLVYDAIKNYVSSYVELYYKNSTQLLRDDYEIQGWLKAFVKEAGGPDRDGLGLKGVPGNGKLTTSDELVQILTSVIYTCSVGHAVVNFPQYEQYSFPPNYSGILNGSPPRSKQVAVTERDILEVLPSYAETEQTLLAVNILSQNRSRSLGDFDKEYVDDPQAVEVVKDFRKNLKKITEKINERNTKRSEKYIFADPELIPNSISI